MRTILPEFIGSMERIRNNLYFSFLALNFVNQRPFQHDVILPVNLSQNIMTAQSLNSFDNDGSQEYGNSIRRHFLNDIVIAYERYSMLMIASHNNGQVRIDPCHIRDRTLVARLLEQLPNVYQPDDVTFLVQLRRLRNSIVHYNGVYSITNELNYTFGTQSYESVGNEGQNISIEFDNILWIYDKLMDTVRRGNTSYFTQQSPTPLYNKYGTVDNEIEKFKSKIKNYKDDLFGITLFYRGTKLLQPSSVLEAVNFDKHYKSIMNRGETIISKAEEALKEVKISHNIDRFREIKFPPLAKDMPPIIDNIPRLKLLIETYAELFPGRDRKIPLTERENMLLMNKVIEKF